MEQAGSMTPSQIEMQSDEYVCQALRDYGIYASVPVIWLREAQKRRLEACIEQGARLRGGGVKHCFTHPGGVTSCF
jgi:hypothetical protein